MEQSNKKSTTSVKAKKEIPQKEEDLKSPSVEPKKEVKAAFVVSIDPIKRKDGLYLCYRGDEVIGPITRQEAFSEANKFNLDHGLDVRFIMERFR